MRSCLELRRLEYRVCGDREVDVATLKEHTECSSERLKVQLFEILESFTNEQVQRFLRQATPLHIPHLQVFGLSRKDMESVKLCDKCTKCIVCSERCN